MKKLLLLPLLFLSFAQAESIQCKVIDVVDGDSIKCLTDKKEEITVNLIDIDAPELDQQYGKIAKQALATMILDKYVWFESYFKDEHEQPLATIHFNSCLYPNGDSSCSRRFVVTIDINAEMLRQGHAWHSQFLPVGFSAYVGIGIEAREAKRGLWAAPNPIPPWEWKKTKK